MSHKDNQLTKDLQVKECYGFATRRSAPPHLKLKAFEEDMYNIIDTIKFRYNTSKFLNDLKKDINKIKKSDKLYVFADKSNNIYKMKPNFYKKLLTENITSNYKMVDNNISNSNQIINKKRVDRTKKGLSLQFMTITS